MMLESANSRPAVSLSMGIVIQELNDTNINSFQVRFERRCEYVSSHLGLEVTQGWNWMASWGDLILLKFRVNVLNDSFNM